MSEDEIAGAISEDVRALLVDRSTTFQEGTLILLPVRFGEDGLAQYREDQLVIPKELRHFGVPAEFLNTPSERTGLSEFASDLVVVFAFGVAQNMTWDTAKLAVQYLFQKIRHRGKGDDVPQVEVSVARVRRSDGTMLQGVRVSGPANDDTAVRIIEALTGETNR